MIEVQTEQIHDVKLRLGLLNNDSWRHYPAYGIWERKAEGQDGKVEVYIAGHRDKWDIAYSNHQVQYQENPNGLPQTMLVLEPERFQYVGPYMQH